MPVRVQVVVSLVVVVRARPACPLVWSGLSGCCLPLAVSSLSPCSGSFARTGSLSLAGVRPGSRGRSSPVPVACRRRCGVVAAHLAPDRPAPDLLGPLICGAPAWWGARAFRGPLDVFERAPGTGAPPRAFRFPRVGGVRVGAVLVPGGGGPVLAPAAFVGVPRGVRAWAGPVGFERPAGVGGHPRVVAGEADAGHGDRRLVGEASCLYFGLRVLCFRWSERSVALVAQ